MRQLRILIPILLFSLVSPHARSAIINTLPVTTNSPLRDIISLSPGSFSKASGHQMNAKERMAFRLLKPAMKKAVRKNPDITVGEFFSSRPEKEVGSSPLFILLLIILFGFLLFVITFQGEP